MSTQSIRPQPSHHSSARHHPYSYPHGNASSARPNHSPMPQQQPLPSSQSQGAGTRKWMSRSPERQVIAPPSPPRSRREGSNTPPIGLGVAFGGKQGGKWWDEEIPAPPASLTSILDSFRRSGEGDRDLLLSILSAKKAEEERLTALIQTRLTILQARLTVHAAATGLPQPILPQSSSSSSSSTTTAQQLDRIHSSSSRVEIPYPSPPEELPRSRRNSPSSNENIRTGGLMQERTPSLISRGGSIVSNSSNSGPTSPQSKSYPLSPSINNPDEYGKYSEKQRTSPKLLHQVSNNESYHLPPPTNLWKRNNDNGSKRSELPPIRIEHYNSSSSVAVASSSHQISPTDISRNKESNRSRSGSGSGSDKSGIEMLLDAGRRAEA